MIKYFAFILLAVAFLIPSHAEAVTYYADFSLIAGCGSAAGTATTTAFCSINQFANAARNPGDVLVVRRNQASTTNNTAVTFTSSGTLNQPISIIADYDGLWPQDFATSSQTYTMTFGTTTVVASGAITGIAAGDSIYVSGNGSDPTTKDCHERYSNRATAPTASIGSNVCEHVYKVRQVQGSTLTLWHPYTGAQGGQSGLSLRVLGDEPIIGTTAVSTACLTSSSDDYWTIRGIVCRSTATGGTATVAAGSDGTVLTDFSVEGNGTTVPGLVGASGVDIYMDKIIATNNTGTSLGSLGTGTIIKRAYISCTSGGQGFGQAGGNVIVVQDVFTDSLCTTSLLMTTTGSATTYATNFTRMTATGGLSGGLHNRNLYQNDIDGVVNMAGALNGRVAVGVSTTTQATSTNLRSGGGSTNVLVQTPAGTSNQGISTANFPLSYLQLFEQPIYAQANVAKTYTFWVSSTSTANFAVNPTTARSNGSSTPELFIECEYYASTTGAYKFTKRSNTASDVDFTGSTAWQDISLSCTPLQSGTLILRGWYAKPVEGGTRSNWFLFDPTIEIQ